MSQQGGPSSTGGNKNPANNPSGDDRRKADGNTQTQAPNEQGQAAGRDDASKANPARNPQGTTPGGDRSGAGRDSSDNTKRDNE